ncbi:hypothetical protein KEJ36_00865 [Candidatus Bathyarchaeota archaeon]|nr:hypothetical protein [Candidatus Bathyarchaeota archaeon]MBS7627375.1 hypothetical protein [Candidatus Bathyarchaeota archaeon]
MMDYLSIALTVLAYLLGLAFAGSFLGRRFMGYSDIYLHRLFRRRVTWTHYLYWRYFCGIPERRLRAFKPSLAYTGFFPLFRPFSLVRESKVAKNGRERSYRGKA